MFFMPILALPENEWGKPNRSQLYFGEAICRLY